MALMKKLQTGGTIDNDLLNEQINKEISGYKLKSKDERKVRDALVQLRDYMSTSEGKSFSVDSVNKTYKITGPGSEKFMGSPDEVKSGWLTGNLKINDNQDAMSIAASIYSNALKSVNGNSTISPTQSTSNDEYKGHVELADLEDYTRNKRFGNEKNFIYEYGKLKTDEDVHNFVYDSASDLIGKYRQGAINHPENYDPEYLNKIAKVEQAIKEKNWDNFNKASYALGWSPNQFILSDEQKADIAEKQKQTDVATATKLYEGKGLSENVKSFLAAKGFTQAADQNWTPDKGATWWNDVLKKNNASVWYNPSTKRHIVVTKDNVFDYGMKDRFAPGWGFSWSNDENGFNWYTPGQHSKNAGVWGQDTYAGQNIGRELITNLPGAKVYGWSAQDQNGTYSKDILGNRDFTKQLEVEQNGHKFTLTRDDQGIYHDQNGKAITGLKITGYGGTSKQITNWGLITQDKNNPLSLVPAENNYNDYNQLVSDLAQIKEEIRTAGTADEDDVKKIVAHLKFIINGHYSQQEKEQALKTYAEVTDIVKAGGIPMNKKGGVLKAQKGMSFNEYVSKYKPVKEESAVVTAPGGKAVQSSKGMLKNMNAWDAISLGGAAISFVPGVGAIGGAVSTVADIASDIQRDGFQWHDIFNWNTAANLGFTALAFFGAGGLKSIQVGAKLAKAGKAVDAALDTEKVISKLATIEKIAGGSGKIPAAAKSAREYVNLVGKESNLFKNVKTSEDLIKLAEKDAAIESRLIKSGYWTKDTKGVLSATKIGEGEGSVVKFLNDKNMAHSIEKVVTSKPARIATDLVINPAKTAGKYAVKGVETALNNKVVRNTAKYALYGAGVKDVADMVQSYNEAPENLSFMQKVGHIKTDDLRGALLLGGMGAQKWREALDTRALANQTERSVLEEAGKKYAIIDGKQYEVTESLQMPKKSALDKAKSVKESWKKGVDEKQTEAFKKELETKLVGTNEEKAKIIADVLKDGKLPTKIENPVPKAEVLGERRLKAAVNDVYNDVYKSSKEYERARKIMARDIKSRGRWNASPFAKDKYDVPIVEEKQPFDIKNINKVNGATSKKLRSIDQKKNVEKYLALRRRKAELEKDWNMYSENIAEHRKGGILKAVTGTKIYDINKHYSIQPTSKDYLPYDKVSSLKDDWRFDANGKYTPDYTNIINGLNDNWWNDNKSQVQSLVSDTNVKINSLDDFKRLATDYKPGRIHEWTFNRGNFDMQPLQGKIPLLNVEPVKIEIPKINIPPITPTVKPGTTGGDGTIKDKPTKNNWKMPDISEFVTNIANFAITFDANRRAGNEQRQAIADSMYTLPYQATPYIRAAAVYAPFGEKESGKITSQARRIAEASSDINKGLSVQLSGADQANEIRTKMGLADQERIDKLKKEQNAANIKTNAINTQTLGQNRANAAQAFKSIHLINSNENLQQAANLVALNKGNYGAWERFKDRQDKEKLFNEYNDPNFKSLTTQLNDLQSTSYTDKLAADYKTKRDNIIKSRGGDSSTLTDLPEKWEDSADYKTYKSKIDTLNKNRQVYLDKFGNYSMRMNMGLPIWAKGGSVTGADRIEMERIKSESKRKMKDQELLYKSIMHDNDILQKALIKVFK